MKLEVGLTTGVMLTLLGCGSSGSSSSEDGGTSGTSGVAGTSGSGGSSCTARGGRGPAEPRADPVVSYFRPGTRLKPHVVAAAPGLDILETDNLAEKPGEDTTWFDAELEIDCRFTRGEDGLERCLPLILTSNSYYLDAACTEVVTLSCSTCEKYLTLGGSQSADQCGSVGRHLTEQLPHSTPLFSLNNGVCGALPGELDPEYEVWKVETVPPERFVSAERVTQASQSLEAWVREASDGSWQVLSFYDPVRQASCDPDTILPVNACAPKVAISGGYYADPACQSPSYWPYVEELCAVEQPTAIMTYDVNDSVCQSDFNYGLNELTGVAEAQQYVKDDLGSCYPLGTTQTSYIGGAPIALGALPALESLVVGTGELRGDFWGLGGVPLHPTWWGSGLIDPKFGLTCDLMEFTDGTLRCVPPSFLEVGPYDVYYESSFCTGARVVHPSQDFCDPTEPRGVLFMNFDCADARVDEVMALGAAVSTGVLYQLNPDTKVCEEFGSLPGYRLGEALDPATFQEVRRVVRY